MKTGFVVNAFAPNGFLLFAPGPGPKMAANGSCTPYREATHGSCYALKHMSRARSTQNPNSWLLARAILDLGDLSRRMASSLSQYVRPVRQYLRLIPTNVAKR